MTGTEFDAHLAEVAAADPDSNEARLHAWRTFRRLARDGRTPIPAQHMSDTHLERTRQAALAVMRAFPRATSRWQAAERTLAAVFDEQAVRAEPA